MNFLTRNLIKKIIVKFKLPPKLWQRKEFQNAPKSNVILESGGFFIRDEEILDDSEIAKLVYRAGKIVIDRKIKTAMEIRRRRREFASNPNYDLNLVTKGFADRRAAPSDDSEILNRICTAYSKAKEVQIGTSPVYRPSNEWLPIYEKPLKEVMAALSNRDIATLARIYENFWRDPCSAGLIGLPVDMGKHFFSNKKILPRYKRMFLDDALARYDLWRGLLENNGSILDLKSPIIGNPYGYYVDGEFIKSGSDYQHYYATAIGRLLKRVRNNVAVEIGGGFGGMAYYLIRDNPALTYIDFDLPENVALTTYYLLKSFPEKSAVLFGEADLTAEVIRNNDFIIMPSFAIEHLPEQCAGLIFNSYSLAEMSRETISAFITQIERVVSENGFFLHVNHTKNAVVVADNFGINPEKFDLLYKIPALWNLGRNPQMDEYEYLYWAR